MPIHPNESTVPLMPCASVEETQAFFESLGFTATYSQTRPYPYLAMEWSGFSLHFSRMPKGADGANEDLGGCIVAVDDVAAYHAEFVAAMRATHGKVLSSGRPRITRYRQGASRFTLVDPTGNSIIFVQRDEPMDLEYGGSKSLTGLAKAMDNARILREFKHDDKAAFRALNTALKRYPDAPVDEFAAAIATWFELGSLDGSGIADLAERVRALGLNAENRARVAAALDNPRLLGEWLGLHE